MFNAFAHWS